MNSIVQQIKKSEPILIPTVEKKQFISEQYSLTQQIFDPFSSSPPNMFISKLKQRMSTYDLFINEANRKSE
jgi:hypothetical protein